MTKEIVMDYQTILEAVGHVANLSGLIAAVFSVAIWVNLRLTARRQAEEVEVKLRLESGQREHVLPLAIVRRDIGRAELLGRIGMLPMRQKGARFSLGTLGSPSFMRDLNRVIECTSSTLVIPCTEEEFDQFDF
jgi:hypothetical protein